MVFLSEVDVTTLAETVEGLSGSIIGAGSIWFLMATALVFFMQAGFAMVESGFTRAKNAGNIIMKNLMDFCLGTICFLFVGYNLLCGTEGNGFIGAGEFPIGNFDSTDWANFAFNLVFCATAATIVSGAMAERTKFISYCIYSVAISLFIYPVEAHWVWGSNGWLLEKGFVDFAGSAAIHMVGGVSALIGAAILGPRIGKFEIVNGKKVPTAIPGHNITLGALGVFILWFGWYGFNGAAAGNSGQLAEIFATTTVAAAAGTITTMILTWIVGKKPDVSMSLNGSLGGLVAITAGCANVDILGALIIGAIAGPIVVGVVSLLDHVLHVDDPVGAVAVHGGCGLFGTLAVGFFDYNNGLFYGGGTDLIITQLMGIGAILLWTIVTMSVTFFIIKFTIGLRVSESEELEGLDPTEHGLPSAYADFVVNK